jgi:micrococcal nuclease
VRLIAVIVAAAVATACSGDDVLTVPPPEVVVPPLVGDAGTEVTVTRVLDGDSFEAVVADEDLEVRLLDVNAPEGGECHGDESRDALAGLIDERTIEVVPAVEEAQRDEFGRHLVAAFVDGIEVNARLVAGGDALAMGGRTGRYAELGDQAAAAGLGMWGIDACGDIPPAVFVADVAFDPEGPDGDVMNDEWVRIESAEERPVDLGGWTLRDESTSNRFVFPDGTSIEPGRSLVIRTGCGDDTEDELFWCSALPVWSNGGDTVMLQDPAGTMADRVPYGA